VRFALKAIAVAVLFLLGLWVTLLPGMLLGGTP